MQISHKTGIIQVPVPKVDPLAKTDRVQPVRSGSFTDVLQASLRNWSKTENAVDARTAHLPKEISELFQIQRLTGSLQLQTECAARAADSVGTTIRRMQQLGGQ